VERCLELVEAEVKPSAHAAAVGTLSEFVKSGGRSATWLKTPIVEDHEADVNDHPAPREAQEAGKEPRE
jgi:hypothetical protein